MVIRVPVGGYIHGALCHSQSIDGYFLHLPGIYIAYPSTADDAKGLLKMACRMNDPVLFLEHKGLYRQGFATAPEPNSDTGEVPLRTGIAAALLDKKGPQPKIAKSQKEKVKLSSGKSKIEINPDVNLGQISGGTKVNTGTLH